MKTLKHFALACFLLFVCVAQGQNLVLNPSFEELDSCPPYTELVNYARNWFNPTKQSPDVMNICMPLIFWNNTFFKENPRTGNGIMGFFTFYSLIPEQEYVEYIEGTLSQPLQANKRYYVSFWVSKADTVNFASNNIGAYFSADSVKNDTLLIDYLKLNPQIEEKKIVTTQVGWQKIQGSFVAQGGEKFMTIGNFRGRAATDTLRIPNTFPYYDHDITSAYYLLDDICVSEDSTTCGVVTNIAKDDAKVPQYYFYPNPITQNEVFLNAAQPCKVIIIDILGKILLSENISPQQSLNVGHLPNGIYIAQIHTSKGIITQKLQISNF